MNLAKPDNVKIRMALILSYLENEFRQCRPASLEGLNKALAVVGQRTSYA